MYVCVPILSLFLFIQSLSADDDKAAEDRAADDQAAENRAANMTSVGHTMEKIENQALNHPSKRVTENFDSCSGRIVLDKNVLLISLLAFSVIAILYMSANMIKVNEKMSKQSEIDSLQEEIDRLTTNLWGCDELNVYCRRENQENEKLKQTTQAQDDIASMKEAKERESGTRDYVQKDVEDTKIRLSETESKLDGVKCDYRKVQQENKKDIEVLIQKIEVLRETLFGANELNDNRTGNWWHLLFTWSSISNIVLVCCLLCWLASVEKSEGRRITYITLQVNLTWQYAN